MKYNAVELKLISQLCLFDKSMFLKKYQSTIG